MIVKKDIILNGVIVGSHNSTGDNEKDIHDVREFLKTKGLYKEITINDSMYGQANSFAEVAKNLYETHLKKSPIHGSSIAPFVVNASFSVELYLKTIHNAYGNTIKGHHLSSIYKNMPRKGKDLFLAAAQDIYHLYAHAPESDIFTSLESMSKAFEQWRYIFEHERLNIEMQSIRYTMHVAHEACCRVRESIQQNDTRNTTYNQF